MDEKTRSSQMSVGGSPVIRSFFVRWFSLGLVAVAFAACAPGGRITALKGAADVRTRRTPPPHGKNLGPITVVHGNGCSPVGQRGTAQGVETLLRNKAVQLGANYVQITKMKLPGSGGVCSSDEYVVEGIAFRVDPNDTNLVISAAPATATGNSPKEEAATVAPGATVVAVGGFSSTCADSERASPEGTVLGGAGTCEHTLATSIATSERTLTFSARHVSGKGFTVSFGGAPSGALLFVYDDGSVWVQGSPTKPSPTRLQLGRAWHDWNFVYTGKRWVVRLDGKVLVVVEGALGPGVIAIGTRGGGTLEVRGVVARSSTPEEVSSAGVLALGWATAKPPAPTAPKRPARMAGNCDIDAIDWQNRSYAASARLKKGVTLVKGQQRIAGKNLSYGGVMLAELDGQSPPEVLVSIEHRDPSPWTGNSVPPPDPATRYAFRLTESCEPEPLGSIDFDADDYVRVEDNTVVRIKKAHLGGSQFNIEEWRLTEGALKLSNSRKAGREILDEPLPACDEAQSLAALPSFAGRSGDDLLNADTCVARKLRARLGKSRERFENYTSMSLSPLERRDGYLVSHGCMVHQCGYRRAAFSVKLSNGVVEAVIVDLDRNLAVSKTEWLTESHGPLPSLRAPIEEANARGKALWD